MKFLETAGIDVSKDTIDATLHVKKCSKQFKNNTTGFRSFIRWAQKQSGLSINQIQICFEHTGLYSLKLATFLSNNEIKFSMVPALEIKKSLGIARGKNDQLDARRIAEYAYLRREKLAFYNVPSINIIKLQALTTLRAHMVKNKSGYQSSLQGLKTFFNQKDNENIYKTIQSEISGLNKKIKKIESEILQVIRREESLYHLYNLITSVKGVGLILAANFLVITNCFTKFETSRQFACYSGIAPFEKQSGTSLKSKSKVSHFANKRMKTLLNLAASSAIQCDPELKAYYNHRIETGKSRMSTLNIVRNKIGYRVFAVVKRGTPYVPLHLHAA
jgi:transposase